VARITAASAAGVLLVLAVDQFLVERQTLVVERVAKQLGLRTRLHDLRHYAAPQLIAGGVDLRTVSGRIGHAGGGATTPRVYTHFLAATDRQAAEVLEKTLRRPRPRSSES
jgi:site-specific recombinase XerD